MLKVVQGNNVPKFFWYGSAGESQALVMELLGSSLESIMKEYKKQFGLPTIMTLGYQMLNLIEYIHSKSLLHRDVKPDNFVLGVKEKKDLLYIIDFGLAKYYQDVKSKLHIPYRDNKSLIGTVRYASINAHIGIEQSRRSDIESLLYCLVYFAKGSLPWQNIKLSDEQEKHAKVMECKLATPIELLCKGLPQEFTNALHHARNLRFEDEPDYHYLRNSFLNLLPKKYFSYRLVFETAPTKEVLLNLHSL